MNTDNNNHGHRRRLRGSPGTCPPIEKRPCIYHFLPSFPPIFWSAHPIFLTSLRQWLQQQALIVVVIVISEFLERNSKDKRNSAPAYSGALRRIKRVGKMVVLSKLRSDFQRV